MQQFGNFGAEVPEIRRAGQLDELVAGLPLFHSDRDGNPASTSYSRRDFCDGAADGRDQQCARI